MLTYGRPYGPVVREKATLICELLIGEESLKDYKREQNALKNEVRKSKEISSEN